MPTDEEDARAVKHLKDFCVDELHACEIESAMLQCKMVTSQAD
jgi:hypothetical protein